MNQEILNKLKSTPELSPDVHDGSYELVRTTVSAYRDVDEDTLDCLDLNAIYLMCIGTWRHSYDKKHEAIHATHLPEVRKQELDHLIDDLKSRADAGVYKYREKAASSTGHMGMFGTGFYSFQGKTDIQSVRAFIRMCVDILDMTDDEEMFRRAASVLMKSFRGMQAAAASVVLHCLKPLTFPVINSNVGSEDIFAALGITLKSRGKLETYVENCRRIKDFRDANFSFKNYRILDMAAWELSAIPSVVLSANTRNPLPPGFRKKRISGGQSNAFRNIGIQREPILQKCCRNPWPRREICWTPITRFPVR